MARGDAGNRKRSFFWNPVEVCESETIESPDEAKRLLFEVTNRCVGAWSSCYDSILHYLSGGLDSAIVLSCFQGGKPEVVCINVMSDSRESDEREFARQAAAMHGRELIEAATSPSRRPFEKMLVASNILLPNLVRIESDAEILRDTLVRERGFPTLFDGQGGDHLFQRRRDNVVASEFIQRHGLRPRALKLIAENARMTGHSMWSVASACLRHGVLSQRWEPHADIFLSPLLTDAARSILFAHDPFHPWLADAARLPASKSKHVFDVIDCQGINSTTWQMADQVHPIISQPVIECSLQIPIYVLSVGGEDRGLARRAFADRVPPGILQRQTKGGFTSFFHNLLLLRNLPYIREFLLDGEFVRAKVLDRAVLESALSGRSLLRGDYLPYVVLALQAEGWVQQSALAPVQSQLRTNPDLTNAWLTATK